MNLSWGKVLRVVDKYNNNEKAQVELYPRDKNS